MKPQNTHWELVLCQGDGSLAVYRQPQVEKEVRKLSYKHAELENEIACREPRRGNN